MSGAGRCAERLKFRAKWEAGLRRLDLRIKLRLLPGLRAAGFCKVRDFAYCEILRDAGLCAVRDLARRANAPDCFCANLLRAFDETCEELSEKASSKLPAFFLRCAHTPCAPHCFRQSSGGFAGFCKGAFAWAHYVFSQKTRFGAWVFRLPHAGRCANLRISFAGIFFAFGAKKCGDK